MEHAQSFYNLFLGNNRAHGTFQVSAERSDGKKKGVAKVLQEQTTVTHWQDHLNGKVGLGIIPIKDNDHCHWGAIDVDEYNLNHSKLISKIEHQNIPAVVCRSKSGGAHIFFFFSTEISAEELQDKLNEIAAFLGYAGSEVFPKQTHLLVDRGDTGNFLNMPYFAGERTTRYAFSKNAESLNLEEFVEFALSRVVTPKVFLELKISSGKEEDLLPEGPPCLQHLSTKGFPQGTRNNGLFNIAVYCRKKSPDNWESQLEGFNIDLMDPPLSSSEVQGVIKSAKRKEYQYTCSKPPVAPYCNAAVCKLRKFGVGTSTDMPAVHSLTKFNTLPPIWFLDVDGGGRLELETDDLHNQRRFQRKCMERLNVLPGKMNDIAWTKLVNHLLENLTIIEAPPDASPVGQLFEYIERFCTGRVQAKVKEEILLGKPWTDNGKHFFRMADLMAFLDRHHFRDYKVHQVTSILRENGAEHHFFNIKGKGINIWAISEFEKHDGNFDTPDIEGNEEVF